MFAALKDHPFGVVAELERTVVLTFAASKTEIQTLIPSFLELDTFQDQWGFVAVAIVRTKGLRPTGFPEWLGNDFWLLGYRVFVRYTNARGKRLRGLYNLGSETDKRRMVLLGNLFTHYGYVRKRIVEVTTGTSTSVRSEDGSTEVVFADDPLHPAGIPEGSPFSDWSEARRYVGPLPFTFSHDAVGKRVLIVEGARVDWHPRPIAVQQCSFAFLDKMKLSDLRLANAFVMDHVPYEWKRGITEPLAR